VSLDWGYAFERWFHGRAASTLVGTESLRRELRDRRVGRNLVLWPRGVDTVLFAPSRRRRDLLPRSRPVWLYVGRVAVEKSLDRFLALDLPGSKVVVGDGPARASLARRFPDVEWRGWRYGEELAAHFASADCFVFPSRTETFGNVILEALASGVPVAAVPGVGAADLVKEGVSGAIDDDLAAACRRALDCSGEAARASALGFSWPASHERFRSALVPLHSQPAAWTPGEAAL
jgi:glycosyltransferase involved in cell wall biosynthesis